jgi:DNA-binding GntR family transcriptional regulator
MSGNDAQVWRVVEQVLGRIRSGDYGEGGRLPTELAFAAEFGVSRATVTRALWLLRWIGLIVGPKGGASRVTYEPQRIMALQLVERAYEIRRLNGDRQLRGAERSDRDC